MHVSTQAECATVKPAQPWVFRYRGVLAAVPLLLAALTFFDETEYPLVVWPVGILIVLFGTFLRLWAQEHLHFRLKQAVQFTRSGPYAFVRNPIYLGNILIFAGATVCSELLWLIPVTLAWAGGVYALVVRYEEKCLVVQYGDAYRRYQAEVPRWFPRALRLQNLQLVNEHFGAAVLAEAHCLLILLPFVLKEFISHRFGH